MPFYHSFQGYCPVNVPRNLIFLCVLPEHFFYLTWLRMRNVLKSGRATDSYIHFIVSDHLKIIKNGLRHTCLTGAIRRLILRRTLLRKSLSWNSPFTIFPTPPFPQGPTMQTPLCSVVPGTHTSELDKGGNMAAVCPQIKTESTNKQN
jgi:hypothetical protein